MKRISVIIALSLAMPLIAQTAKPTVPAKPPVISDSIKMAWLRVEVLQMKTQKQDEETQTATQAVLREIQSACGNDFSPQLNSNGDPECVAKPAPAKTPEPTKGTK